MKNYIYFCVTFLIMKGILTFIINCDYNYEALQRNAKDFFLNLKKLSVDSKVNVDNQVIRNFCIENNYKENTIVVSLSILRTTKALQLVDRKSNYRRKEHLTFKPGTIEYRRSAYLKFAYNLTIDEAKELYDKYGGKCAICKNYHTLHIDHDHKTGKVRGLLCRSCNTALGKFKDNIETLSSAIEYLKLSKHDQKKDSCRAQKISGKAGK